MNLAYLSLGSNIEPQKYLQDAAHLLAQVGKILAISSAWETIPVGFLEQPNFLNAALLLETELTANIIRTTTIPAIEQTLHRVRTANPNASRTIDIDLALFNDEIFTLGTRQIPDPDILTRAFVAIPLAEIAPNYIHPQTGQTLRDIATGFDLVREGIVKREDVGLQELVGNQRNS